jgi:predicted Zn-dependent peptidase
VRESIKNVTVDEVMEVSNLIFNEDYYSLIMLGDI